MRTRLPVKLKVAVLSAALTFAILCLFAVVVGTVAERRIVAGFDDDLRASVVELGDRLSARACRGRASPAERRPTGASWPATPRATRSCAS